MKDRVCNELRIVPLIKLGSAKGRADDEEAPKDDVNECLNTKEVVVDVVVVEEKGGADADARRCPTALPVSA